MMPTTATKSVSNLRPTGSVLPTKFQVPLLRPGGSRPAAAVCIPRVRSTRRSKPGDAPLRSLKPSQLAAYNRLAGEDYLILNSPTGWGKSTVLVFLAAIRLLTDPRAKCLIIVPQKVIKKGFVGPIDLRLPTGGTARWEAGLDLCDQTEAKVRSLVGFLCGPPSGDLPGRVAVATHATFVAAYDRMQDPSQAFEGTTCVVDEGHHVRSDPEGRNRLGYAVNALIDLGVPVWLATAFFFRGDSAPILSEEHLPLFSRYHVPFDQYFGELTHIKSYAYDFVAYKGGVIAEVETLLRGSQEPTLIYCPTAGSPVLGVQPKRQFCDRLVGLIKKHYAGSSLWEAGTKSRRVILDLADVGGRAEKLDFLMKQGERVAAVLTVGMLKEGADWVQAARVIDLVPSGSDQERGQKFGRLMRDCPGKTHVVYYNFLPGVITNSEEEQRRACSNLFTHFHVRLVMENGLRPIRVRLRNPLRRGRSGDEEEAGEMADLLGCFSEQRQKEIHEAVTAALVSLNADKEKDGQSLGWQEASGTILDVLRDQGCGQVVGKANLPALRDQIALIWRRRKSPDADLAELIGADWDKVWVSDLLEPLRHFTAGSCGLETFEELRRVLGARGQMAAESWARETAAQYKPGELPSQASEDPRRREDALKIAYYRMYKKGKKNGIFYPSVEAIFEEAGHVGIFETSNFRQEAEAWARECVARYRPESPPSLRSRDHRERFDAQKIQNMKRASYGEGTCTYYPSVEAIFEAAGFHDLFAKKDRRREIEDWAVECAGRYRPGGLPSEKCSDPQGRRDGKRISYLRAAKRGKSQGLYYPTIEPIFEAAGHRDVFEAADRPHNQLQESLPSGRR